MSIPAVRAVQDTGVLSMNLANAACEGVAPIWANDKMDVIPHQAVGPELQPMALSGASEEAEIVVAIDGGEEDIAAAISAMGNMVRQAGDDNSRSSWHGKVGRNLRLQSGEWKIGTGTDFVLKNPCLSLFTWRIRACPHLPDWLAARAWLRAEIDPT